MRRYVPVLCAAVLWAPAAGGQASAASPQQGVVAIVERGQPMRLEAATVVPVQAAAAGDGAASCALPGVTDRRGTTSAACLACHDGSTAVDARSGHRFGVDYAAARSRTRDLRHDPEAFNPAVILQDGVVGCLSCHAPGSSLTFHLAAPTSGQVAQRLCVACHVQ